MQRIDDAENPATAPAGPAVERVPLDAPWAWLAAGWRDLWTAPWIGLTYGGIFAGLSFGLTYGLMITGYESLILALAGGFLLIGPVAAIGLYETSRRLEAGGASVPGHPRGMPGSPGQPRYSGGSAWFIFYAADRLLLSWCSWRQSRPAPPICTNTPVTSHGLSLLVVGTLVALHSRS